MRLPDWKGESFSACWADRARVIARSAVPGPPIKGAKPGLTNEEHAPIQRELRTARQAAEPVLDERFSPLTLGSQRHGDRQGARGTGAN